MNEEEEEVDGDEAVEIEVEEEENVEQSSSTILAPINLISRAGKCVGAFVAVPGTLN